MARLPTWLRRLKRREERFFSVRGGTSSGTQVVKCLRGPERTSTEHGVRRPPELESHEYEILNSGDFPSSTTSTEDGVLLLLLLVLVGLVTMQHVPHSSRICRTS